MNPIPRIGSLGKSTVDVAILGGTLLASMAATVWVTKQAESRLNFMSSSPLVSFGSKALLAGAVVVASRYVVKDSKLRGVVAAGAFAPLLVDVLERFVPSVAAAIPVLSSSPMMPTPKPGPSQATVSPANRALQLGAALNARLNASLEDDQSYIYGY